MKTILDKYFFTCILILVLSNTFAFAQEERRTERDSLQKNQVIDSTQIVSDKFVMDTIGLWKPLSQLGSITSTKILKFDEIRKSDLLFQSYSTISDLFYNYHIGSPVNLGLAGSDNSMIIDGGFPNGANIRLNNSTLNNSITNNYNLSLISIESIESIEILRGAQSAIFGQNSTSAVINIQEIIHNTQLPYTKLWYYQGIDDFLAADGIYSQNFAKNMNITLGFRSMNSPGTYVNQSIESWNLRAKLRWNLDSLSNVSLSENYSSYRIGENGGNKATEISEISNKDVIFDEIESIPIFRNLDSRLFQHNLTASYLKYFDTTFNQSISSNLSFIYDDYMFQDADHLLYPTLDSIKEYENISLTFANSSSYELKKKYLNLKFGYEVNYSMFDSSKFYPKTDILYLAAYSYSRVNLGEFASASGGVKYFSQDKYNGIALGGRLDFRIDTNLSIFADYSLNQKVPNLYATGLNDLEIHNLLLSGFDWKFNNMEIVSNVYWRNIHNLTLSNLKFNESDNDFTHSFWVLSDVNIIGLDITFKHKYNNINTEIFTKSQFNDSDTLGNIQPLINVGIKSFYTHSVGKSIARIGVEFEVLSSFKPVGIIPFFNSYYTVKSNQSFSNNGINAFVEAKLGSAYLNLKFKNLLGYGYYYTSYYPMPGRYFELAIKWAFLE